MTDLPVELTPERLAELDAAYQPPWSLEDWLGTTVVTSLWDTWFEALQQRRTEVSEEHFEEFRQRLVREAAIDTGAIEGLYVTDRGFTTTVAERAIGWTAVLEREKGVDVARLVEGQLEAYEFALDLATGRTPMSEAAVRHMHELACAGQDTYEVITSAGPQHHPLLKGAYKQHRNHVLQPDGTTHSYAPVERVAEEMHQLVNALNDSRFEAAHPAVQAAFAHHALVVIHPFADGNGRVARVLASVFLMRATSLPFALYADERPSYLDAIRAGDRREIGTLVRFVADRTVDTMTYLVEELRRSTVQPVVASVAALARALEGPGGLTHQEIDGVAERLLELVEQEASNYTATLQLPPGVAASVVRSYGHLDQTEGHRRVLSKNMPFLQVIFSSTPPADAQVISGFDVLIAKDSRREAPFRLHWIDGLEALDVRIEDVYPQPREAVMRRIRSWLGRILDGKLATLATTVEEALRNSGYR